MGHESRGGVPWAVVSAFPSDPLPSFREFLIGFESGLRYEAYARVRSRKKVKVGFFISRKRWAITDIVRLK